MGICTKQKYVHMHRKNSALPRTLTPKLENYLKAIYFIQRREGKATVKKIALALGVKVPSASEAVKRLMRAGMIRHENYGEVSLTEKGMKVVKELEERYRSILSFLNEVLGIDQDLAAKESCILEHLISKETALRMASLTRKLKEKRALKSCS
ncbi:MAG: metal-dependent transcriptional regulator [Thermoprotei archaeon]|nr:MAG: metal-dependent transcriptional regulator [Thermoprotei archaeon]